MAPLLSLRFYPPLSERDGSSVEELTRRIEAGTKREPICTAHISSLFPFSNLLCSAIHPANDTQRENKAVGLGLLEGLGWRVERAYPASNTQRENKAVGLGLFKTLKLRMEMSLYASESLHIQDAFLLILKPQRIRPLSFSHRAACCSSDPIAHRCEPSPYFEFSP